MTILLRLVCAALAAAALLAAPARADDMELARRHLLRGQTALEMAQSPADLDAAVREFDAAIAAAPAWAAPHYNRAVVLGKAQRWADAIASYQRYLELAPDAADAAQVRDEIVRLQYRLERAQQQLSLAGTWREFDPPGVLGQVWTLQVDDAADSQQWTLRTAPRELVPPEMEVVLETLGGLAPFEFWAYSLISERFELRRQSEGYSGVYVRAAFTESKYGCQVPEYRASAQARLLPDGLLEIRYGKPILRVRYSTGLFSTRCQGVETLRVEERSLRLKRVGP
jgi:tetratricopeptide (TPR) repeat protein